MSSFVFDREGIVLNRTAATARKVAVAAWDLGSREDSSFVSVKPDLSLGLPQGRLSEEEFHGTTLNFSQYRTEGHLGVGPFASRHLKPAIYSRTIG
jgi:hypothetical protein